jgi:hypothetical protein
MSTGGFLIPPCPLPGPVLLRNRRTNAHFLMESGDQKYRIMQEVPCS